MNYFNRTHLLDLDKEIIISICWRGRLFAVFRHMRACITKQTSFAVRRRRDSAGFGSFRRNSSAKLYSERERAPLKQVGWIRLPVGSY